MAQFVVDFSQVDLIPVGLHKAEIVKVELRQSQSSEHPYLNWEFQVLGQDQKAWMMTSLSPKSLFRLKQAFVNCDINVEGPINLEIDESSNLLISPEVVGRIVTIEIGHEEYEGTPRVRVKGIVKPKDDGSDDLM